MLRRMKVVLTTTAVLFVALFGRIYSLSSGMISTVATAQSTVSKTLFVSRGSIYDRYLRPLVNRETQWLVSVNPYAEALMEQKDTLSTEQMQAIREAMEHQRRAVFISDHPLTPVEGLVQFEIPVRYAGEVMAPHVIGYTNDEGDGVTGVERGYNEELSAFRGEIGISYAIDALGRPTEETVEKQWNTTALSEGGIVLTLDRDIQQTVQELSCSYLTAGAVVVSEVGSGEVLAAVSAPYFHPEEVEQVLDSEQSPLLDRSLCNYNIGSVFKVLIAAAALENGISEEFATECEGRCDVDGVVFACRDHGIGHPLTMREAMAVSCNTYFIRLAQEIGAAPILAMARQAAWQESLLVAKGIQTEAALCPTESELSVEAALGNLAIGQGTLMASVYHVHSTMAAVANGGEWVEPSMYAGQVDPMKRQDLTDHQPYRTTLFSGDTADRLRLMLGDVVASGTGTSAKPTYGTAAGKTGTAETGWLINGEEVVQSWFSGYYPSDRPQYVITVLSENGGRNGRPAATLFAAVANALFETGMVEISQELY